MRQTSSWWIVALSISMVASGCVGGESTGKTGDGTTPGGVDPGVAAGPAEFDETTGAIEGQVTDDQIVPIVGAQVGILPDDTISSPLLSFTDASGRFTFSRVPPGKHAIQISALGFESVSKSVDVQVGQVSPVNVVLIALPSTEPYMNTVYEPVQVTAVMYKLSPSCVYATDTVPTTGVDTVDDERTQMKTCGGTRPNAIGAQGTNLVPPCGYCESHTSGDNNEGPKYATFNEEWQTIVGEVTWQAQSGATGRGFLFDINAPNITRGDGGSINQASKYTFYKGTSKAPIQIRVDKPTTLVERGIPESDWNNYPLEGDHQRSGGCTASGGGQRNCDWFWRIFGARCDLGICDEGTGPDYGLLYGVKAEIYFSYFIRQSAPDGFSALPDA